MDKRCRVAISFVERSIEEICEISSNLKLLESICYSSNRYIAIRCPLISPVLFLILP
jgi:hypothetical protein